VGVDDGAARPGTLTDRVGKKIVVAEDLTKTSGFTDTVLPLSPMVVYYQVLDQKNPEFIL